MHIAEHGFGLPNLKLGAATASLQIEGGNTNNSWYDWAIAGNILDGSTPLRATDHWRRWREDTDLMADLGLQTYRMSLEWARIEPEPGCFDDEAIQRYRDEIELVQSRGIEVLVSLHHFSNPTWFQELGEFTNPQSVPVFLRFVAKVVGELGDLVTDWCTINEPNVYATQAHLFGEAPPAKRCWTNLFRSLRHLAEAHCRAYELIHHLDPRAEVRVGFAHHMRAFTPLEPRNSYHRLMTRADQWAFQEMVADAMLGGEFGILGQPATVTPGRYYDYLGLNYYSRTAVSGIADGTLPGRPINDLGWEIYPEGLIECAQWLHERYPAPIWITENGTCDNGSDTELERFRPKYIYDHLRVISESKLPIERYFHWCFVDNWEWREGEVPRFGLVALDYETQERTVKPSGEFYADIISAGGVTEDAYRKYVAGQRYPMGE